MANKLHFIAKDGMCPALKIAGMMYYIRDVVCSKGYLYELMCVCCDATPKWNFANLAKMLQWAKDNGLHQTHRAGFNGLVFTDADGFTYAEVIGGRANGYITMQRLHKHYHLSPEFDNYKECEEYALSYLRGVYNPSIF